MGRPGSPDGQGPACRPVGPASTTLQPVQPTPPPVPVHDVIERALEAYGLLADLGEEIEDEWSYVNDLREAWGARLAEVARTRGTEPVAPEIATAVELAADECALITDPHRAIDWLSTFPQVVLLALGEQD